MLSNWTGLKFCRLVELSFVCIQWDIKMLTLTDEHPLAVENSAGPLFLYISLNPCHTQFWNLCSYQQHGKPVTI